MAVVHEGECTEVAAARGRWVPSPLFDDAPAGTGACFYTWAGEKGARVDRDALREHIGFAGALTPSPCGSERLESAELVSIPHLTPGAGVGAVGCDVCGTQRDGKIRVVIPPEKVLDRELEIRLSDGTKRTFRIQASDAARRMIVTLPPAPAGTHYVNGRFALQ